MNDKEKQGMMPKRDFLYLSGYLVIILIAVCTMVLGDSSRAGENLSFASTMVSIVLAVIAIVIPLIDGAGQKQNINQLRDTSEELQTTVQDLRDLAQNTEQQLLMIAGHVERLMAANEDDAKWKEAVLAKFEEFSSGENGEKTIPLEVAKKTVADTPVKKTMSNSVSIGNTVARINALLANMTPEQKKAYMKSSFYWPTVFQKELKEEETD